MNQKIIKLLVFMLLIGLVIGLLVTNVFFKNGESTNNVINKESYDISALKDKENLIIYLKNDPSIYYDVYTMDRVTKYYEEMFGISVVTIDCSKLDKKSLKEVYSFTTVREPANAFPYIYLKKGNNISLMYNCAFENNYRDMLVTMEFMDKKALFKDVLLTNYNLKEVLSSSKENLVFVSYQYDDDDLYEKYRKHLNKLSFKYDFDFYSSQIGSSATDEVDNFFVDISEKNPDSDIIAIIGSGKIKKYAYVNKEEEVDKFLKTNGYIK